MFRCRYCTDMQFRVQLRVLHYNKRNIPFDSAQLNNIRNLLASTPYIISCDQSGDRVTVLPVHCYTSQLAQHVGSHDVVYE